MLNICFVKFGDKVQGFNANELLYDMIIPIVENIKEPFKIWVATDEPIEVFIVAGGIYLFMTFLIHNLIKYLEKKYSFQ